MLTGLYKPSLGRVQFRGRDITAAPPGPASRDLGVARTFQNIRLFGTMTAVENVLVGRHGPHARGRLRLDLPHARGPGARSARAASAPASCSSSSA